MMPCAATAAGCAVQAGHHCLNCLPAVTSIDPNNAHDMDGCDIRTISKDHALANSHPFIHQAHITPSRRFPSHPIASHCIASALQQSRHGLI